MFRGCRVRGWRLAFLGVVLFFATVGGARAAPGPGDGTGWVALSYADLIDPDAILRDGRNLKGTLAAAPAGYLQPFLDSYSSLLPYGLEMISGGDGQEQVSIVERYPPGAAAPAWVALFRAGKFLLTSDGRGKARLFLPGDSPATAWRQHYSVIRHPLATLLPGDGSPLTVEVYAYRNDYRKAELRLRLRRHTVSRRAFPSAGTPPDLGALSAFFEEGGRLEGVRLTPEEGLTFYAEPGPRSSMAGSPLSLADLVVAYRAAWHAGDNKPFVSIDPNRDHTRSTVNFGGYLEDTRIGQVVLDADKRFKTITCGLDPDTFKDVREETRKVIPSFLTTTERTFLDEPSEATRVWADTRFWFYADSIGIDADPAQGLAVVTRPSFTADAERKGGTRSARNRRDALPWQDRETIRQLNANYDRYARSFPEIGQLSTVARLLAISAALKEIRQDWLDLDALLAVELPPFRTPRELTRMISMSSITTLAERKITEAAIVRNSRVQHLSPALDRTVEQVFVAPQGLAAFLRLRHPGEAAVPGRNEDDAGKMFSSFRTSKVRELIRTEEDLSALAEYLGARARERAAPGAGGEMLRQLEAREAEITTTLRQAEGPAKAAYAEELAQVRADQETIRQGLHGGGKPVSAITRFSLQVLGGIDLQPDHFKIRKAAESPALARFKALTARPGSLIKGRAGGAAPPGARSTVSPAGSAKPSEASSAAGARTPAQHSGRGTPARVPPTRHGPGATSPGAVPPVETAPEPETEGTSLPPVPTLRSITIRPSAGAAASIVGQVVGEGRIVFTRQPGR